MCGILCTIILNGCSKTNCSNSPQLTSDLSQLVAARGPDNSNSSTFCTSSCVTLVGHVLWTQGVRPSSQPFTSPCGRFALLFNGDIYSFNGLNFDPSYKPQELNDGEQLFKILCDFSANFPISNISRLRGPFSIIFYDSLNQEVYFCRDFFGRQSLLFGNFGDSKTFVISSVSNSAKTFEIPAAGLFKWNLASNKIFLTKYFQNDCRLEVEQSLEDFRNVLTNFGINFEIESSFINPNFSAVLNPNLNLDNLALKKLFELSENSKHLKDVDILKKSAEILDAFVTPFLAHLRRAVGLRVGALQSGDNSSQAKIGLLFSGGLDSTVLAFLVAELVERKEIEKLVLVNVAFGEKCESSPDRGTSREAYEMFEKRFGKEKVELVLLNVSKCEVEELRRSRIRNLILPCQSVLDDSVGCCLFFAAKRAKERGGVRSVLLGSGADELLGGYSRHRSAYQKGGWSSLSAEMQYDLDRISIRNMGRDNRVVADHGISPRIPFLDEGLVHFLSQDVPIWAKCFPLLPRGLGEKLLLRAVATVLFGEEFFHLASFPKRAMQFGSRIAKLENGKEKGGQKCDRLKF